MAKEKVEVGMARESKHEPRDIIKDIIFFFITVAGTYGYVLFILLLFSLIFLRFVSFINLDFDHMLIYSGVAAGISAVWYIIKMVRKYII